MSDKDDASKPQTPPESKPDSADGKRDASGDDTPAPEEVEAEIVGEDDAPAPVDVEAEPAGEEPESAAEEDAAAPGATPAAKFASGLSPGVVVFLLFAVAVAVIFTVWRFQTPSPDAEPPVAEASDDASDAASAQADALDAAGVAEDAAEPPTKDIPADKISNEAAGDAKDAVSAIEPTAEEIAAGPGLPPPPPESAKQGNQAIQQAAKEAARLYGPDAETEDAPAEPDGAPDTDDRASLNDDAEEPIDPRAAIETLQREAEERAAAEDARLYGDAAEAADDTVATPAEADDNMSAETMSAEPADSAPPVGDAGKIANELAALKQAFQAQTDSLNSALEEERRRSARQSAEIAALRSEVGKVRSGAEAPAGRRAAAALALISLQRAVDAGGPYKEDLEVLERLAPDLPAVERLRARAETGVPTAARLKERFPEAARAAIAASDRARAKGPFGRLMANLQSLVSARPARPQAGDSIRAVISRAEARLDDGDVAGAVSEFDAVAPVVEEAMRPWLVDARARAAATRAINDLNGLLLNAMQD